MNEEEDRSLNQTRLMFRDFSIDLMRKNLKDSNTIAELDDFIEQWLKVRFKLEELPK